MGQFVTLDMATLRGMDAGGLGEQFKLAQKQIVEDMLDNTAEKAARKLTLTLEYKPKREIRGSVVDVVGVSVEGNVKISVPKRKTYPIECSVKQNGTLVFDPDAQRVAVEADESE